MKLTDVAEKVLRAVGEPMHSKEIVAYAQKAKWTTPRGRTPANSLQAAVWLDIKVNRTKSRFVMVALGKGSKRRKYWLRGLPVGE